MTEICYEIVAYRIEDEAAAAAARDRVKAMLAARPGFIAWTAFCGADDASDRVDLIAWTDIANARAAAELVETDSHFADFRASVSRFASVGHYVTPSLDSRPIARGCGVELGRFRLKPGINERIMHAAYDAMISRHLVNQSGWRRQHLVKLQDGSFVDLAFASSETDAERICASWVKNEDCDRFLSMIEPLGMEFGSIV